MSIAFLHSTNTAGGSLEECVFGCIPYPKDPAVWLCYSQDMDNLAHDEAKHHDEDDEDPVTVHHLHAWRNTYYHAMIRAAITQVPAGSALLDIGTGSGLDAEALLEDYTVVLTDVSPDTLRRTHQRLGKKFDQTRHMMIACDGQHLPFTAQQFNVVFMVATFHHFAFPQKALAECYRVLKPGGRIILGVEPNKTYFKPMKWCQRLLFTLSHTNTNHISKADRDMEGFSYHELKHLFDTNRFKGLTIRPMWLFAGWLHYLSEFIYRALRLKKRITYPLWFEKGIVRIDEILFKIPGMRHLGRHWILTAQKK